MTSLVLPTANTAMMQLFLEHVSQTFAEYFIVIKARSCGLAWRQSAGSA
jgi:hypothetical protein